VAAASSLVERDVLAIAYRGELARSAWALWPLGNGLLPFSALAEGRHTAAIARPAATASRRTGVHRLGHMVRRWQQRARSTSCRRGEKGGTETALGRSHGGWGSKLHLLTDGNGLPLAALLSPGQRHESCYLEQLLTDGFRHRWPAWLLGDRGYSAPRIRRWLLSHGIQPVIPYRKDERQCWPVPPPLDRPRYRRRNVIERTIGKLKQCRSITTRFDKLADTFLAMLTLAFLKLYLKTLDSPNTA
jgi:transposase